jgi:hypothetical protein
MKDLKAYLIIGSLILGVYFVAQYYKPKPVNWNKTFSRKDKIPFGTYVMYERLKDIFPQADIKTYQQAPYLTFTENEVKPGAYIIVAPKLKIDQYDFEKLKEYVEAGNDVFIATYYLGDYFNDSLKIKISSEFKVAEGKRIALNFVNPQLDPTKHYVFDRDIGNQYFSSFDSSSVVVLGKNSRGNATYIQQPLGKGNMYLMASPFFFTNYNLLKPDGAAFAEKALSYIRVSDQVIWDDFSALGTTESTSLVRVFLRHTELKWAYYIAFFGMLAFVIYEMKRRQRIIPVIEPLKNSTTEFVQVVGQLYYQQRDNSNIANKMVTYLLEEIRSRYHIKTNEINNEFMELLIKKSGISKQLAADIISHITQLRKYRFVSDSELIELNKNIELFHKQSR